MARAGRNRRAGTGWLMLLIVATLGVLALIGATTMRDPSLSGLSDRAELPLMERPDLPTPRLPPVNPPGVPDGPPPIAPRG